MHGGLEEISVSGYVTFVCFVYFPMCIVCDSFCSSTCLFWSNSEGGFSFSWPSTHSHYLCLLQSACSTATNLPNLPSFFSFFCGETLRCHNLIKVPPQNRIWAIYISTPDSCTQTCQPVFPVFLLMQGNLVDSLSSQHLFVVFPPEHILGNWTFSEWENWEIGSSITDGT